MNCIKCGRDIGEDQVFCETCLTEMENYPVKPGTAIHIPARDEEEPKKAPVKRKPVLSASEQVLLLKKKLRRTRVALVILLLLCGMLCFVAGWFVADADVKQVLGQNYSTVEPAGTTIP